MSPSAEAGDADSTTAAGDSDSSAKTAVPAEPAGPKEKAHEFVDAISAGEFDKAARQFDDAMTKAMTAAQLKETWGKVETQAGKFQKRRGTRSEKATVKDAEYNIVFVTCEFERSARDVKIVYTTAGKVTGMFFTLPKAAFVGKEDLWLGELNAGGTKLRLLVHLGKTADGKHQATLDSLDQGQKGIPFDKVIYENGPGQNGTVRLEAMALQVIFEGKIDETGQVLSGEWRQGGAALPLTFKKIDAEP